jgi:hypothetical protein
VEWLFIVDGRWSSTRRGFSSSLDTSWLGGVYKFALGETGQSRQRGGEPTSLSIPALLHIHWLRNVLVSVFATILICVSFRDHSLCWR